MDLLDRYLQSVRWWLPKGQDREIVAELEADLRAQIDEQQAKLGHPLDAAQTAAILLRCGDPLTVAGRLLPQPPLLDPVWSMVYRFVVKVVLVWVLPAVLVLTLLPGVLSAPHPSLALLEALSRAWLAFVYALGMITLIFAVLLRFQGLERWRASWDPRRLPRARPVRDSRRIPRAGSITEIVVDTLFLLWWLGFPAGPPFIGVDDKGVHFAVSAIWAGFHARFLWPVASLVVVHLALAVFNLRRPFWTRPRLGLRAVLNAGTATIAGLAVSASQERFLAATSALQARPPLTGVALAAPVTEAMVWLALLIAAAIAAISCLVEIVRLIRLAPEGQS